VLGEGRKWKEVEACNHHLALLALDGTYPTTK